MHRVVVGEASASYQSSDFRINPNMTEESNSVAVPVDEATGDVIDAVPEEELSPDFLEPLQAAAFRSLCQHLQLHSAEVSNMDLMTLAGFCRNCLAKVCFCI